MCYKCLVQHRSPFITSTDIKIAVPLLVPTIHAHSDYSTQLWSLDDAGEAVDPSVSYKNLLENILTGAATVFLDTEI